VDNGEGGVAKWKIGTKGCNGWYNSNSYKEEEP